MPSPVRKGRRDQDNNDNETNGNNATTSKKAKNANNSNNNNNNNNNNEKKPPPSSTTSFGKGEIFGTVVTKIFNTDDKLLSPIKGSNDPRQGQELISSSEKSVEQIYSVLQVAACETRPPPKQASVNKKKNSCHETAGAKVTKLDPHNEESSDDDDDDDDDDVVVENDPKDYPKVPPGLLPGGARRKNATSSKHIMSYASKERWTALGGGGENKKKPPLATTNQVPINTRSNKRGATGSSSSSKSNLGARNSSNSSKGSNNSSGNNSHRSNSSHNNRSNSNSNNRKQKQYRQESKGKQPHRPPFLNQDILEELIDRAEYELNFDAYRGMALELELQSHPSQLDQKMSAKDSTKPPKLPSTNPNPWKQKCQRSSRYRNKEFENRQIILNVDNNERNNKADYSNGKDLAIAWVQETCQCECPCLISWTHQAILKERAALKKKKGRNNKRKLPAAAAGSGTTSSNDQEPKPPPLVGQRLDDNPNARYPCDYNPYCTGSLGGAVNKIWQDEALKVLKNKQRQHANYMSYVKAQQQPSSNSHTSYNCNNNNNDNNNAMDCSVDDDDDDDDSSSGNNNEDGSRDDPMIIEVDSTKTSAAKKSNKKNKIDDDDDDDDVELIDVDTNTKGSALLAMPLEHGDNDYAPHVANRLKLLRPCILVPAQPIRDYLSFLLSKAPAANLVVAAGKDNPAPMTVDDLLAIFNRWQSSLIFSNPLRDDTKMTATSLPIALPPGISNLGATCYLNTQLQCLAQNKAFLEGIVSWRVADKQQQQQTTKATTTSNNAAAGAAVEEEGESATTNNSASAKNDDNDHHTNVMNSVLTNLQSLLVNMVEGSQRTINTLEFSNSLGLEHGEQQDPNEFARLLFERMHEAFQQHPSLKNLLPSLFEGTTTYETKCLKCNTTSTRRESFMDLNLPIVKPTKKEDDDADDAEVDKKKKKKNGLEKLANIGSKITHFFAKALGKEDTSLPNAHADTDLQFCLDRYSTHEMLDGDNQYFCSTCNCKQDATRETALGDLPPVLNVQLSRYVFDRTTFMKKKLTDKVLLPRKLQVQTKNSDAAGDAFSTKTYVLCAVMKHQGNSAYSGHYVAEVQDFLSGQWFEFNDEKVTVLKDGPSCSYIPSHTEEEQEMGVQDGNDSKKDDKAKKAPKLLGSSDAYNLYYILDSFLANITLSAYQAIQAQEDDIDAVTKGKKQASSDNILQNVALERRELYKELAKSCLDEGRACQRLRIRERRIREDMLSLHSSATSNNKNDESELPVWVETDLLRRFLSCKDRLDDVFGKDHGEPLLMHKQFLCQHEKPGLAPRVARRGKLLPPAVYRSYLQLLADEHALVKERQNSKSSEEEYKTLTDLVITPENMVCDLCTASYRAELKSKLEKVKLLRSLYVNLDPKAGNADHDVFEWREHSDSDDSGSEFSGESSDKYAFVVSKKFITEFRKKIERSLLRVLNNTSETTSHSSPSTAVSVDIDDEGSVPIDSLAEGLDALDLSLFQFDDYASDLDEDVNATITCAHGNCTASFDKKRIRWLNQEAWEDLKHLFPNAIEHKLPRRGKGNGKTAGSRCPQCDREQQCKNDIKEKLENWYEDSLNRGSYAIKAFHKQPKADEAFDELILANKMSCGENSLRVYCPDDYVFVARSDLALWNRMMSAASKLKGRNPADENGIKIQMVNLLNSRTDDWMRYAVSPLEDGFLRSPRCKSHGMPALIFEKTDSDTFRLSRRFKMIKKLEYENFVGSMADICKLLSSIENCDDDIINLCDKSPEKMPGLPEHLRPPTAQVPDPETDMDDDARETIRLEVPNGPPISLTLHTKHCIDEKCCRELLESLEPRDDEQNVYGAAADDPIIVVESDSEEAKKGSFKLKCFELKDDATIDQALSALTDLQALPSMNIIEEPAADAPRRSNRKRKTRFPSGVILGETSVNVKLDHNLSSVRLLLMEALEKFDLDSKLFLIFSPPSGSYAPPSQTPLEVDVSPMDVDKSLSELNQTIEPRTEQLRFDSYERVLKEVYLSMVDDPELKRLGDPEASLILLRQKDEADSGFPDDALMDVLLGAANTLEKEDKKGGKKKPAERGFQGTLLSSFRPTVAAPERSNDDIYKLKEGGQFAGESTGVECAQLPGESTGDNQNNSVVEPTPKKAKLVDVENESANCAQKKNSRSLSPPMQTTSVMEKILQSPTLERQVYEMIRKKMEGLHPGELMKAVAWVVLRANPNVSLEELIERSVNRYYETQP